MPKKTNSNAERADLSDRERKAPFSLEEKLLKLHPELRVISGHEINDSAMTDPRHIQDNPQLIRDGLDKGYTAMRVSAIWCGLRQIGRLLPDISAGKPTIGFEYHLGLVERGLDYFSVVFREFDLRESTAMDFLKPIIGECNKKYETLARQTSEAIGTKKRGHSAIYG